MAHSQAYAQNEWQGVKQWNPPTLATLSPGETRTYGVRFLLSPQIRDIEKTLEANQRPVAVGIPGYVLPMDLDARLFLRYGRNVKIRTIRFGAAHPLSATTARPMRRSRRTAAPGLRGWAMKAVPARGWRLP
jgi:hypothetical protein